MNFFADDAVLLLKDKNVANLKLKVNEELKVVDKWMRANRLSLNYNKSSYFVGHSGRKNQGRIQGGPLGLRPPR